MKTLLTLFALILTLTATAGTRTLEWDASPPEDFVVKYHVYELLGPGWTKIAESETPNLTMPIPPGPHTYAVTAVSVSGLESGRSNEVQHDEPLPPPQNLRIRMQVSTNLKDWQTVATYDPPAASPRMFARVEFVE